MYRLEKNDLFQVLKLKLSGHSLLFLRFQGQQPTSQEVVSGAHFDYFYVSHVEKLVR